MPPRSLIEHPERALCPFCHKGPAILPTDQCSIEIQPFLGFKFQVFGTCDSCMDRVFEALRSLGLHTDVGVE